MLENDRTRDDITNCYKQDLMLAFKTAAKQNKKYIFQKMNAPQHQRFEHSQHQNE